MSEWSITEPRKLAFDDAPTALHVRVVNGTVNVVGTEEGSARLEVTRIEGPPLKVSDEDGVLTVAYEDLPWKGFLKWLDPRGWRRSADISLAVPSHTRVRIGVVAASATVSGVRATTEVRGVSGDTTLVALSGPVTAETVSGNVETQRVTGDLTFQSVSGDLTVMEGAEGSVTAESVNGSVVVDLDRSQRPAQIGINTVSGEIALRLAEPTDAEVEIGTTSGTVSNAFDELRISGTWGAKRLSGRLGPGRGRLRATTVSGPIALLRRPAGEDFATPSAARTARDRKAV
ncbi:DUF4097 family beta strand repeat protein [Streptomyces sp. NA04227]|uniref:DUF4097 family beta strand repeat-containing protein n=1 Tax=Streptomyces sp. NA04227 TaxID=2742136 RepID=UPI001590931B|nr:DUF4097 family beta strand repeat-containing protein [Streptomyces sp. NA04227]QKW11146.1 DUF4097 family beta strand repeat protein [Streptomyces sp. NA04227]